MEKNWEKKKKNEKQNSSPEKLNHSSVYKRVNFSGSVGAELSIITYLDARNDLQEELFYLVRTVHSTMNYLRVYF